MAVKTFHENELPKVKILNFWALRYQSNLGLPLAGMKNIFLNQKIIRLTNRARKKVVSGKFWPQPQKCSLTPKNA